MRDEDFELSGFGSWREAHKLELMVYFVLSKDLSYISSNDELVAQSETIGRLLNGLIVSTERRQ